MNNTSIRRSKKPFSIKSIPNNVMVGCGLLVLCIIMSFATPVFLTSSNLINVILQAAINATLACGMTFVILTAGIDLSVGSIVALSGVIMGHLLSRGIPLGLSLLACVLMGGICGVVNGIFITYAKLPPFITTLGTMSICRGFALLSTGGRSISGFGPGFVHIGNGSVLGIPILILIMVVTYIIGAFILRYTRAGRYVYAIGGNSEATRLTGINVNRYTMMVYIICGLTAGIAAIMLTARLNSAQPIAGEGYELNAIAATVIGGTSQTGGEGGLSGTIIGALIISVLTNGLNLLNISSYVQQIVIGSVIILAVLADKIRNR